MIDFEVIAYKSDEYLEMVELRNRILRLPIGLTFSESDLKKDEDDLLLVASLQKTNKIVACCILAPLSEYAVQLRQMAVDSFYQGKGLGSEMINFAEQIAIEHNFGYLCLHARKTAVGFYKKHGYAIEGDLFMEVGIPHFDMGKIINANYK